MKYIVAVPHYDYDGVLYSMGISKSRLYEEVNDWLYEEIGDRFTMWNWPIHDKFTFVKEIDAIAFKLRWL